MNSIFLQLENWISLMPRRTFRCTLDENTYRFTCNQFIPELNDYLDGTGSGLTLQEAFKDGVASFQATIWKRCKSETSKPNLRSELIEELKDIQYADLHAFKWLKKSPYHEKIFKDKQINI